jgi:beta/gamma crystallin
MSVQTLTFTKEYRATPDQFGVGAANRMDQFDLIGSPQAAVFCKASLRVIESHGLSINPAILSTPSVGSLAHGNAVLVTYQMLLPMSYVKYEVRVTVAVPTRSGGSEEHLSGKQGRMMIFEDIDFGGNFMMIENAEAGLTRQILRQNTTWDNQISSFVVLTGNWKIFRHENFQESYYPTIAQNGSFAPGVYRWVNDYGIGNDEISSLLCV